MKKAKKKEAKRNANKGAIENEKGRGTGERGT
jgi:hypothetical protein